VIEELGGRIDLIGKIAVREVDEFIDEVIPPFGISRQPYALTDDEIGVAKEPGSLGPTVGLDWD
jgi:hypothetical protein